MVKTISISEKTTLKLLRDNFNLQRSEDEQFFREWSQNLPEISSEDCLRLDKIINRYFYQLEEGMILEEGVKMMIVSPLLEIAGFYDPPYKMKFESSVELAIDNQGEILAGRIDALVIHHQLWVWVLEAKRTAFSLGLGIPQALAYMLCNPNLNQPTYGLLTSGDNFIFIKLIQEENPVYALSKQFTLFNSGELYEVLKILRKMGNLMINR
ncbi:MAG: restriction endonuclease subunit R [Lyngbya sp.]|nr:restriction endonuclease subunit R [Lyngbya sp.]